MPLFKRKPKTENLEEFRDIADDVIESDFVPYACHWDAESIVTKNGEVLQTIRVADDSPRGVEAEETDLRSTIRAAILAAIDTPDYAVWVHTVRRKTSFQAAGEFKRDFAGYLDRFWKDRNDWEHKFINEVFITVVREGQGASLLDPMGFVRQIIPRFDVRNREGYLDDSCAKLSRVTDKMIKMLSPFGAKKLGFHNEGDTWYSEPCSFLSKLVTLQDDKLPVAQISIADYLTDYDLTFGYNAMEVRLRSDGRRRFGAYLTIKEFRELPADSLDVLLKMPIEFVINQCFTFTGAKNALKIYEYQKKLFATSNSSTLAARSGLQAIIESNTGKEVDYCEYQLGIFLLAESVKSLESSVVHAVTTLASLGLVPMREDMGLEECYWAMQPANFQCIKRLKPLNTSAMGGFANLNFMPFGQAKGNHWGAAVSTLQTITRTPYFFNFHIGDNGHTVLLGPTESGKKVLMNFLIAQSRKYDGKLFYFDRGRSAEIFIRSIDGAYYNAYPGVDSRPYMQIAFNPLQLEDSQANRDFLERWLLLMAGSAADATLAESCKPVIATVMQKPKTERQLTLCAEMLVQSNPLWEAALAAWLPGGKHAAVFGSASDTLVFDGKVYGFEMGNLVPHADALPAVFAYLMHRIMQCLDGKPSMIVMDEAWDLLATPVIAPRLKGWLQALKERNAMAFLASEQIDEIKHNPLNAELFPQIATKLFLPDDSADASYADAFGLSLKDIAYLPVMNNEDRHFLVVREKESVVLEIDLSGMVDIVSVLAASPLHLQMLEQAVVARGISPSQWMPKFLETI
jgi:type IV secretion system protein VirB4